MNFIQVLKLQIQELEFRKMKYLRFFNDFIEGTNVRNKPGVGIGLYLVREILSMEKGFISVESKYGKGSKFLINLSNN